MWLVAIVAVVWHRRQHGQTDLPTKSNHQPSLKDDLQLVLGLGRLGVGEFGAFMGVSVHQGGRKFHLASHA